MEMIPAGCGQSTYTYVRTPPNCWNIVNAGVKKWAYGGLG